VTFGWYDARQLAEQKDTCMGVPLRIVVWIVVGLCSVCQRWQNWQRRQATLRSGQCRRLPAAICVVLIFALRCGSQHVAHSVVRARWAR
jgi:hypothetical protein